MPDLFEPERYMRIPVLDVPSSIAFAHKILAVAPKKLFEKRLGARKPLSRFTLGSACEKYGVQATGMPKNSRAAL